MVRLGMEKWIDLRNRRKSEIAIKKRVLVSASEFEKAGGKKHNNEFNATMCTVTDGQSEMIL